MVTLLCAAANPVVSASASSEAASRPISFLMGSSHWFGAAGRLAAGADPDHGICRSAKQGHHRGRRRLVPVLSAHRAGQAAWRIRQSGAAVDLVDLKGTRTRSAAAPTWFRFRPLRQSRRQETGIAVLRPSGRVLVVSPSKTSEIEFRSRIWPAGEGHGVVDRFFLKFLLKKNGLDPTSASVIGVGLGATAVAAMQQARSMRR